MDVKLSSLSISQSANNSKGDIVEVDICYAPTPYKLWILFFLVIICLSHIQFIMFNETLASSYTLLLGITDFYQMAIREVQSGIVR